MQDIDNHSTESIVGGNSMKRVLVFLLCLMPFVLCACDLPVDILEEKAIVCQVTAKEQQELTVVVQSPDIHYDEGDALVIRYAHVNDNKTVAVGNQITFTYDYLQDVTTRNDLPYLTVESVSLTQWTPPATEATMPTQTTGASGATQTTQVTAAAEPSEPNE